MVGGTGSLDVVAVGHVAVGVTLNERSTTSRTGRSCGDVIWTITTAVKLALAGLATMACRCASPSGPQPVCCHHRPTNAPSS